MGKHALSRGEPCPGFFNLMLQSVMLSRLLPTLLFFSVCCGCGEPSQPGAGLPTKLIEPPPVRRKFDFKSAPEKRSVTQAQLPNLSFPKFTDVAQELGIQFVYDNGASPKALMVESTGGGCGWFDYDGDGRLDLFVTQGGVPDISPTGTRPPDACFRQTADGQFVDVALLAGLADTNYGQAVAIADVDNDGFDDLFVSNVGPCVLYLNQGDGTFRNATDWLKGKRNVWSTSAAWGDVDHDGDLDLYVCNYTIYDPYHPIPCLNKQGEPTICHPVHVSPEADEFFINSGDGELVESSQRLGLFGPGNKGLGVVIADFTDDGWPDIFVANDVNANFLFVNESGQSFKESAYVLGGAFSAAGETQANMGIAFGDYDQNGRPDVCITHFTGEGHTLYQNLGPLGLQDVTARTGLRDATMSKLGFGTVMSDFNLDGHMDLFFTHGHIDPKFRTLEGYEMTPQLFSFDGSRWRDGSAQAGAFFSQRAVGRGVASADYDRDGDLDLCIVHQNSPLALLRNDSSLGHGLRVRLVGRTSNRNGYNARVTVTCGDRRWVSELAGGTSYAATHERILFFGLGPQSGPGNVEVVWPSGIVDNIELPLLDTLIEVHEGQGAISRFGAVPAP